MRYLAICLCCLSGVLFAQQTVAPTPPPEEPPAGDTIGDYTVTQSFEIGFRALSVSGNGQTYQSQVNFGNGLRLLDSDVEASSKDGQGQWFDQLSLKTEGLGNDPYESARFRVEKNGWYEYNMTWRLADYFNPGLTTANGVDAENLQHRLQDHDLTLLPHSRVQFLLGFSRSAEDGPALTSFDELNLGTQPLFEDVRRTQDEYRLGMDAKIWGFKLNLLHDWEFFRDDTEVSQGSPASFLRIQPDHGETSGWKGFLARDFGDRLAVNGRITYQGSGHGSSMDEEAYNVLPSTVPAQQILVTGEASRPETAANLNVVWSPAEKVSVTNQASFNQVEMNGNDTYTQFDTGTLDSVVLNFQFLGIRTLSDALDISYDPRTWLGISGGYQLSSRLFRSVAEASDNSEPAAGSYRQTNVLNAGTAGFRLHPMKRLSINMSGELGHTNRPIYPVSEKNYHAFRGRVQYKAGSLLAAATAQADYNVNSDSISTFSSQSRNYGAEAGWVPKPWLTFDLTYSKLHLNTAGGLAYFVDSALITGTESLYISNLHFVNAGVWLAAGKRADVYLGYSRVQDTGDGRNTAAGDGLNPVPAFNVAQTYPLLYDTPQARVTVPIVARLRFNAGWQYYRYHEQFLAIRDYHANTAYTSLAFSF
jgi:hypothetical protein